MGERQLLAKKKKVKKCNVTNESFNIAPKTVVERNNNHRSAAHLDTMYSDHVSVLEEGPPDRDIKIVRQIRNLPWSKCGQC